MRWQIDIDQITVWGVTLSPAERPRFIAALECELIDRIGSNLPHAQGYTANRLPSVRVMPTGHPSGAELATQVAAAVHQTLTAGPVGAGQRP